MEPIYGILDVFKQYEKQPKAKQEKGGHRTKLLDPIGNSKIQPTLRRNHEQIFNTHSACEDHIEDIRSYEPDSAELANRIVRAVAAGEWASQVDVDDEEALAAYAVLGVRIGTLRRQRGLSLDELALSVSMDADVLFAIELGLASAEQVVQHLERIADALGDPEGELRTMLMQICPAR